MLEKTSGNFTFKYPAIEGIVVIEPKVFTDSRGQFLETYSSEAFVEGGVPTEYHQDNESFSLKGVLRGLHLQAPTFQGKLVRVSQGIVYDVAVDLRKGSKTLGHSFGVELSSVNRTMMYVPEGFAHGFLALQDSVFVYKCTRGWVPGEDMTIAYDDPSLSINWLEQARRYDIPEFILSAKDISKSISLEQFRFKFLS